MKRLLTFAVFVLIVLFGTRVEASHGQGGGVLSFPEDGSTALSDTLAPRYSVKKTVPEQSEDLAEGAVDFPDPDNVKTEVEYDERLVAKVWRAVDELPEQTRAVFVACVVDGKKYREAAEEFGISIYTVNTYIKRAYKTLRDNLGTSLLLFFLMSKDCLEK